MDLRFVPGCTATRFEDDRRAALDRDPFDPAALRGLGLAVLHRRRPAQAAALLSAAAAIDPCAGTLCDLGAALAAAGRPDEAERHLRRALSAEPGHPGASIALAELLRASGRTGDAIALLRAARGDDATAAALAIALIEQGNAAYLNDEMAAAEASYHEAVRLAPALPAAHLSRGNALTALRRLPEAEAAYRTALGLDPGCDDAAFALSLSLQLAGRYGESLGPYERRRQVAALRPNYGRRPGLAQWRPGGTLAGRRVLVTAEQGFGDMIQHARFVPALAAIAAEVVLELPWPLAPAFQDLPGAARIIALDDPDPACDVACPLLSLPLALGTDSPPAPPYVAPRPERAFRWAAWLARSGPGRRVGLACSGGPGHPDDKRRSFPLALFGPLLDVPGATFVLVQNEIRDTDRDTFDRAENLRCPEAALTDFADTAALLAELDLVVSVDTSVAHLAGAMALPAWTLLPYYPDCRWMLGRDDSPWYPTMRLYRQERPGDWDTVIRRVRDDLIRQGER
jgi:tetratricopeptide (TPR) repeat protein